MVTNSLRLDSERLNPTKAPKDQISDSYTQRGNLSLPTWQHSLRIVQLKRETADDGGIRCNVDTRRLHRRLKEG